MSHLPNGPVRSRCLVDGCDRLEEFASGRSAGGLCAGHRRRKALRQPLETPLNDGFARRLTRHQTLLEAAIALSDVDTADDRAWHRAVDRHRKAALRYAAALLARYTRR